ncbi:Arsenical pump membrane protein [Streptomyces sp. YIM 130001]|uniref:SLC13 family permease n=1 Tax=Streptomyces sp. YIM 130001 TaxID=2259644 RepID=UPI000E64F5E7|nr:SLC13 family permease [Streptomyces sp. YIM 130001]RII09371.1 Arsenical pump membrane protein [Streptomyces sp. YIM 130001]
MIGDVFLASLSVAALAVVLVGAVLRPFGKPEAVFAVPAAGLVVATGAIPLDDVREEAARLGPVVGFLAAVLVLARLCDDEGLFRACGAWMARRARQRPGRLLGAVFALASLITAALSLDATVVLLTPVVFATARRMGAGPGPHIYATGHLSNSASLLLPVSNLTNLLAYSAAGLSFTRFALLMTLPWLAAVAVEYAVLRRFFARDLKVPATGTEPPAPIDVPIFALVTVAATLVGFAVASALGLDPAWAAAAGAAVLGVRALARRETTPRVLLRAADLPFLAFVLALGIVVRAVLDHGLGDVIGALLPNGDTLPALLATAALAALLANLINNLPAVLALLPLAAPAGPGVVLAVLLGVNIGPNLTYAGSLATLLWRRIAHRHGYEVRLGEFTRLGLLTVPAALLASTAALWVALRTLGT